jgi:stage II sporulation protein D
MAACVAPTPPPELPASAVLPATVRVQVRDGASLIVLAVPIEDYVAATIISEVDPPNADEKTLERMYEVQATISRTYAVSHRGRHARDGFDLCATTHCQLYEPGRLRTSKWARVARQAATATAGQVVWFQDSPARTVYHADCGGHTSAAADVWEGDPRPYLAALRDSGSGVKHVEWRFESGTAALRDALNRDGRTAVGRRLDAIAVAQTDSAGRAEQIALRGSRSSTVRGEVFREVVGRAFGAKGLRSTLFSIGRAGDTFVFTGRGFGHGVGLCQAGAFARLQ